MKKHCEDLEPLIEAIADGSHALTADDAAHVASCRICSARLERARAIENLLAMREVATPSASLVMRPLFDGAPALVSVHEEPFHVHVSTSATPTIWLRTSS